MSRAAEARGHATPVAIRGALVLADELVLKAFPDRMAALRASGAIVETVDYGRLGDSVERLQRVLQEHGIDFVLFARNDQVFDKTVIGQVIRALRVGYSSVSGIDTEDYLEQTATCLDDLLSGTATLASALSGPTSRAESREGERRTGTFSLVFDLEQLGGARFGLPRILDLLDRHGVTATFFTTNFVQEVYRDVASVLSRRGHELGVHGLRHEYLAGRSTEEQRRSLGEMVRRFGSDTSVTGANFIGRMDAGTIQAMAGSGLGYFVQAMEHRYRPFAYRRMPLRPLPVWTPEGTVTMVPISVETNNRPWFSVRNMLDSAILAAGDEDWAHINVLLHPFRDGARCHLGDLERILVHMRRRGYAGVPVRQSLATLPVQEPDTLIFYSADGVVASSPSNGLPSRATTRRSGPYHQRVWRLFQSLEERGARPALCAALPDDRGGYAVHPCLPAGRSALTRVTQDDVLARRDAALRNGNAAAVTVLVPDSGLSGALDAGRATLPRVGRDLAALVPEVALRVAYRLTPEKHLF